MEANHVQVSDKKSQVKIRSAHTTKQVKAHQVTEASKILFATTF